MKQLFNFSLLIILLVLPQLGHTQDTSTFDLKRSITLSEEDAEIQDIVFNVTEKTSSVHLGISCKVFLGNLKVEIYDPKGKKQGEFSIESQLKDKSNGKEEGFFRKETVEGQIEKNISNPLSGNWVIKLIPKKTLATIEINSRFITQN